MLYRILNRTALALALLASANLSIAADTKPTATPPGAPTVKASAPSVKASAPAAAIKKPKAAPVAPGKLVDINSASKASLMKLPGVGEAEANKIIAGRPYLTKTRLVSKNILPMDIYDKISKRIIARQAEATGQKATASASKKP